MSRSASHFSGEAVRVERALSGLLRTERCKSVNGRRKTSEPPTVAAMVERIVGCKWSLHVLDCVRRGIVRPGAIQRAVPGLSAKVLNERLRRLVAFGVLERRIFAEVPPRVEYRLTPFGERFLDILDRIAALERERAAGIAATAPGSAEPEEVGS